MERMPERCPICAHDLDVTQLRCPDCGHEVHGTFARGRLVNLPEPHATLLESFLRVRGNMKEMERELGLAYSTVRARLDEAFTVVDGVMGGTVEDRQREVLDELNGGHITAAEAIARLHALRHGRPE